MLEILGVIGTDATARDLRRQIEAAPESERGEVYIDSRGGSLAEADRMLELLRPHRPTALIDTAHSAAAYLAVQLPRRMVYPFGELLIHSAWRCDGRTGDSDAEEIAKRNRMMAAAFVAHSRLTLAEVETLIRGESYVKADEAVRWGLADGVVRF
ncbi:ATP-dependent Clp protease proteolytic subunit [Botrimarina sp.]|uniref:ATP-dependent Clp protease proteolytic subunit n=1 Tax=Botrimarina sp. TaxID=2795802 RepID=UPI0032ED028F